MSQQNLTHDVTHNHPLELHSLTPGVMYRVQGPALFTDGDRLSFVIDPIRRAVADGIPVLYVDWSRRSQRWGDVLAAVGGDPAFGTLVRREQPLVGGFEMDLPNEPLGTKVLRAVSRHREVHGTSLVVLDATQPGSNCGPSASTDVDLTGFTPEDLAPLTEEPVVLIFPGAEASATGAEASSEHVSPARARANARWGLAAR